MLIFSDQGYCRPLQQAQLTLTEVNQILDFIVNQNSFFASSQNSYGEPIPDVGSTDLLVSTNGQQKRVTLYVLSGGLQATPDAQTQHVSAIEKFLQNECPCAQAPKKEAADIPMPEGRGAYAALDNHNEILHVL